MTGSEYTVEHTNIEKWYLTNRIEDLKMQFEGLTTVAFQQDTSGLIPWTLLHVARRVWGPD